MRNYKELHPKDVSFCNIISFVGVVLSIASLFQLMYFIESFDIYTVIIFSPFITAAASFLLLGLKKKIAPYLIIASTLLVFLLFILFILGITFSLLIFLFLIFSIVSVILIFVHDIPKKLKYHNQFLKEESTYWQDKL